MSKKSVGDPIRCDNEKYIECKYIDDKRNLKNTFLLVIIYV